MPKLSIVKTIICVHLLFLFTKEILLGLNPTLNPTVCIKEGIYKSTLNTKTNLLTNLFSRFLMVYDIRNQ
jgi:hypothetical protein